jgi:hypothetical protein
MPKTYLAKIVVPSGSRTPSLFKWLGKLLEPHGMAIQVLQLEDGSEGIAEPGVSLFEISGSTVTMSTAKVDSVKVEPVKAESKRSNASGSAEKVHVLHNGRTLCGMVGRMPKGERWVGKTHVGDVKDPDYLCAECREFLE